MLKSVLARGVAALVVAGATLVAVPVAASATPAGDNVVINELYTNGTAAGATYKNRFFELYNPTDAAISVEGWSLQYKPAAGPSFTGNLPLGARTLAPDGYLLVQGSANSGPAGIDVPNPDVTGTLAPSGSNGVVALSKSATTLTTSLTDPDLVDLVGYGTGNLFEGTGSADSGGVAASITRSAEHADSDQNATDFTTLTTPTPCSTTGCPTTAPPEPEVPGTPHTIAEVQGTGTSSPLVGDNVQVDGVVTGVYRTGGFDGVYLQTQGSGGGNASTRAASDGVFVSSAALAAATVKGDFVEVNGKVSESFGLTQITTSATGWTVVNSSPHGMVTPTAVTFPQTATAKESLEGMLLDLQGAYTVTNNFSTNQYGEVGLVDGDEPLATPTNVVAPGAQAAALQAENDGRLITLDDGSSLNLLTSYKATPLPWLTATNEVRVGAPATVVDPVILDYRFGLWKLQPQQRMIAGQETATFGSTRAADPEAVGGDVTIGTFNVLNYFPTTAARYVALDPANRCTYYDDRAGNHITANRCGNPSTSSGNGPRGAADDVNLGRQQTKIVKAINTLDADVVSLEEIENSIKFGPDRDAALSTLVSALNADAGEARWAFVPSPAAVPASEDVIRTALIYQPAVVAPVGDAKILIGQSAFDNAREPLAQSFKPVGGSAASTFAVIVNHFKSKGSGTLPGDADQGDGQGASNASRKAQATALIAFADDFATAAGTEKVFLTGDFNSYNEEDPVKIIEADGFVNVPRELTDKETYQFDGQIGSLDHVFASAKAFGGVTGADIWNINAYESVAREYSRFNYNATDFYQPSPFRASDHDPEIIGFDPEPAATAAPTTTVVTAPRSQRFGTDISVGVEVTSDTDTAPGGVVTLDEGGTTISTATLEEGRATLTASDLPVGDHTLAVTYAGDATHAGSRKVVVVTVLRSEATLTATTTGSTYGTSAVVKVVGPAGARGMVYVGNGDDVVGVGTLSAAGTANIAIDKTLVPGSYDLTVYYAGNQSYDPATAQVRVIVAKAPTTLTKSRSTSRIVKDRTRPKVSFSVRAPGVVVDGGTVKVYWGSSLVGTGTVSGGRVTVRLRAISSTGRKAFVARYSGTALTGASARSFTLKVVTK